jgi:hypothetical protein
VCALIDFHESRFVSGSGQSSETSMPAAKDTGNLLPCQQTRTGDNVSPRSAIPKCEECGSPGRGLQEGPDRARGLGDVREELGERIAQSEGLAALFLGRERTARRVGTPESRRAAARRDPGCE